MNATSCATISCSASSRLTTSTPPLIPVTTGALQVPHAPAIPACKIRGINLADDPQSTASRSCFHFRPGEISRRCAQTLAPWAPHSHRRSGHRRPNSALESRLSWQKSPDRCIVLPSRWLRGRTRDYAKASSAASFRVNTSHEVSRRHRRRASRRSSQCFAPRPRPRSRNAHPHSSRHPALAGLRSRNRLRRNGPPRKSPAPRIRIALTMPIFIYSAGVLALTIGLVVFSYFDRTYRELGRVHPGRIHQHLDTFEADVEPRLHMERRRAALGFSLLARFWLDFVAAITARGVLVFVPGPRVAAVVRTFLFIIWPVQAVLELLISVLHLSEESEEAQTPAAEQQQAIEALVDAATEEGIIEQDEARLIESVVEFGDKRVRDVMTPRPDVIAIRADASLEELRDLVVETKFSRLPVFEKTLDEIAGIVMARDMLEVPDREAAHRTVRELMRPALFVPETKFGSELLKEMQRKNQQMAVVIDEYGLMAGLVTIEDLVEEIVGEIGEEDRTPAPDVVREASGALIIRGSVQLEKVSELFGVQLDSNMQHSAATTIAGLLNSVAGHVPRTGEVIDADGLRFEVIEANQRKVLRVRAKPIPNTAASTARTV